MRYTHKVVSLHTESHRLEHKAPKNQTDLYFKNKQMKMI